MVFPFAVTTNEPRYGCASQSGLLPGRKVSGPGSCRGFADGSTGSFSVESSA